MDASPLRNSSKSHPSDQDATHKPINPRAFSYTGRQESHRPSVSGRRLEGGMRSEQSDGEIIATSPEARVRAGRCHTGPFDSSAQQDGDASTFYGSGEGRRARAAQLMVDRIRRMEDNAQRRSSSNAASGIPGVPRTGFFGASTDRPTFDTPSIPGNSFLSRDLNRPLPRRPSEEHLLDRRSREIVLPRWQPDAEVNECPICHTAFSWLYRKHHCRKCGRVVCATCSPHRITIPRQFIVHAPDDVASSSSDSAGNAESTIVELTGDDDTRRPSADATVRPSTADYRIDPALGGGQEVRLCNPCVPDPNLLPPLSYYYPSQSSNPFMRTDRVFLGHMDHNALGSAADSTYSRLNRSHSGRSRRQTDPYETLTADSNSMTNAGRRALPGSSTPLADQDSSSNRRHSHQPRPNFLSSDIPTIYGSAPGPSAQESVLQDLIRRRRSGQHTGRHHQHASLSGPDPSQPSPVTPRRWSEDDNLPGFRPMAELPQLQLREDDECPVCHAALPPLGEDGDTTGRENHIDTCFKTHFSSSTVQVTPPHASVATSAAGAVDVALSLQAEGASTVYRSLSGASLGRGSSSFFQQRRRAPRMVKYSATEKDCVGEDGREVECAICFEEFAVGDDMGRLECLCKFHKACIQQWWETKGPGACPLHQLQEGA